MATRPETAATAKPTPIASHSVAGVRLGQQPARPVQPSAEGDRRREQEAEARGRLAGQAERQAGR